MNTFPSLAVVTALLIASVQSGAAAAEGTSPPRDIGGEARSVFAAKCAVCHGADVLKPKGRFGYVLDLKRVAANPEIVVPFRPEESELWDLVRRGEMPQADSPRGPLDAAQKETIRTWIAAGAPDALHGAEKLDPLATTSAAIPTPAIAMEAVPEPSVQSEASDLTLWATTGRLLRWIGKFHLLVLHFPIALIVAAGMGELGSLWRPGWFPPQVVRFCLWLAALAAIPTAALGWLHAAVGNGASSPQLLATHRWLGTAAAVWLLLPAVSAELDAHSDPRSQRTRLMLLIGVIATALAAHFGGLLAHGADFFAY